MKSVVVTTRCRWSSQAGTEVTSPSMVGELASAAVDLSEIDVPGTATLLDGSPVHVRRLGPHDRPAVLSLAAGLDEHERYLRFFTAHPVQLDTWATGVTSRRSGNVSVGAFDGDQLLGLATYVRGSRADVAELAIMVAHGQHLRGIGTALLRALSGLARAEGVTRFVADVLNENHEMHRVLIDGGWPLTRHRDGDVTRIDIDIGH